MPDHQINLSDEERAVLEIVRQRQGLASIEQAAEWLIKSRLGSKGQVRHSDKASAAQRPAKVEMTCKWRI